MFFLTINTTKARRPFSITTSNLFETFRVRWQNATWIFFITLSAVLKLNIDKQVVDGREGQSSHLELPKGKMGKSEFLVALAEDDKLKRRHQKRNGIMHTNEIILCTIIWNGKNTIYEYSKELSLLGSRSVHDDFGPGWKLLYGILKWIQFNSFYYSNRIRNYQKAWWIIVCWWFHSWKMP